jgi:hypothetical protein
VDQCHSQRLSRPNIAAIYGFEDSGDVRGLVWELVEGRPGSDRAGCDALPDALPIARQLATALPRANLESRESWRRKQVVRVFIDHYNGHRPTSWLGLGSSRAGASARR